MIRRRALFLACSVTIVLAACSNDSPDPAPTTPSEAPTQVGNVPVKPDDPAADDPGGPVPEDANAADERAAEGAATATMEIWVQGSTLEEPEWREQLNATLTATGQDATSTTWGYRIQDTDVVGEPEIVRANAGSAVLRVATDYTTYYVTVVKSDDGTWLTSNLTTERAEGTEQ